eukprot:6200867-Pleurochrysis_carterae.AAC.2
MAGCEHEAVLMRVNHLRHGAFTVPCTYAQTDAALGDGLCRRDGVRALQWPVQDHVAGRGASAANGGCGRI